MRMGQSVLGRGAIVLFVDWRSGVSGGAIVSFVDWGSGTAEAESTVVVEIARPGEKGSPLGDTVVWGTRESLLVGVRTSDWSLGHFARLIESTVSPVALSRVILSPELESPLPIRPSSTKTGTANPVGAPPPKSNRRLCGASRTESAKTKRVCSAPSSSPKRQPARETVSGPVLKSSMNSSW